MMDEVCAISEKTCAFAVARDCDFVGRMPEPYCTWGNQDCRCSRMVSDLERRGWTLTRCEPHEPVSDRTKEIEFGRIEARA